MSSGPKTGLAWCLFALSLGASAPALAQDEPDAVGDAEEAGANDETEILVTAQFREQRLQDTPIAITAMSGETIENRGFNSVVEVAATAPNVNLNPGASAYGTGMAAYIRGIGQYDNNFAYEPGVGIYVDDVYHGVLVGSMFDLLDLDRVEILRGPQGTLAGKNSIGGAIKLYSREPKGTGEGFIQATYGSFNRIEVRGAYDLAVAEGVALRVSAFSKRRGGHVDLIDFRCDQPALAGTIPSARVDDSCKVGTLGGIETWGLRASLGFYGEDVEINVAGSIIRDDSEGAAVEQIFANRPAAPPLGGVPYDSRFVPTRPYINYGAYNVPQTGFRVEPIAQTDSESLSIRAVWRMNDNFQLTSITGYEHLYGRYGLDNDGSPLGFMLTSGFQPYRQFTQELRLNGDFADGLLETTVGLFHFDSKGYPGVRLWQAPAVNFLSKDPVTNRSRSAFAHVIVHPVEEMSLIGGLRYTDDRKTYLFTRFDPTTLAAAAPPFGPLHGLRPPPAEADSLDWRLGADYRFIPELMVYASVSTGYKGGGISPRPFVPSQAVPFGPETVTAYEVGFKSDLFGRALRLNAAAFLNKYQDIILTDTNGYPGSPGSPGYFPFSAVSFNAGDADIKGLELEAELRPVEGLSLSSSLGYLDFEYKRLDPNAVASGTTLTSVAPFISKWKWSANASYRFELGGGGSITPQFFADYQSQYFTDAVNRPLNSIAPRTVLNANITYRTADEAWELIGGVTNLTDKHYYVNSFDASATNGTTSAVVARPREFYVTLRRNF